MKEKGFEETLNKEKIKKILQEFKRNIKSILQYKLVELILYGSYARGDYELGSDIDVLLIIKNGLTKEEQYKVSSLASNISLKYDVVISCFEYDYQAYINWETPFLMNIRREGVRI